MAGFRSKIGTTLEMIKWEHSIFALPSAVTAMLLAAGGWPGWRTLAWIVVAMVSARSAAMAFNRWADAELDRDIRGRAIRVAQKLAAEGIKLGDRVATLAWNGHRHLETWYGIPGSARSTTRQSAPLS